MEQLFDFLNQNKELLVSVVIGLIGLVKLTSWGRAQAQALDAVVAIIERFGSPGIKEGVRAKERVLSPAARQAIQDAVSVADPKKPSRGIGMRIFRGLLGLIRR